MEIEKKLEDHEGVAEVGKEMDDDRGWGRWDFAHPEYVSASHKTKNPTWQNMEL